VKNGTILNEKSIFFQSFLNIHISGKKKVAAYRGFKNKKRLVIIKMLLAYRLLINSRKNDEHFSHIKNFLFSIINYKL